jgi:ABC-2 type transport system permease protein
LTWLGDALALRWRVLGVSVMVGTRVFSAQYTPLWYFLSWVPRVIFQTLFFVLLARCAGGPELARFAFVGNAVGVAAFPSVGLLVGLLAHERATGTLPVVLASPAPHLLTLLGRCAFYVAQGFLSCVLAFGLVGPMLGFAGGRGVVLAIPLCLLVCCSLTGLGLLLGCVSLVTRADVFISNTACYLLLILCGVNVPLGALPPWLEAIARWLPLTNGLEAVRAVIGGAGGAGVWLLAGREAANGALFMLLGYLTFAVLAWRARRLGTFEFH